MSSGLSTEEEAAVLLYAKVQAEYVKAGATRASLSVGEIVAVVGEKSTGCELSQSHSSSPSQLRSAAPAG